MKEQVNLEWLIDDIVTGRIEIKEEELARFIEIKRILRNERKKRRLKSEKPQQLIVEITDINFDDKIMAHMPKTDDKVYCYTYVYSEETKNKLLSLLGATKPLKEETVQDEDKDIEEFFSQFKKINSTFVLSMFQDKDKHILQTEWPVDLLTIPDGYRYDTDKAQILKGDKVIIDSCQTIKNKEEAPSKLNTELDDTSSFVDSPSHAEPVGESAPPPVEEETVEEPVEEPVEDVDLYIIEIRKKNADESVEAYETYLKEKYKAHGIINDNKKIRIRYPHEIKYSGKSEFKYKGSTYTIKYAEGTTYEDCNKYYKEEYLKSRQKKDKKIISGKEQFLKDIKKIKKRYQTVIEDYKATEFKKIIETIENDTTLETSEEEANNIVFSGNNFPELTNREYIFKLSNDSLQKLENLGYLGKYFPGYTSRKTNEPLKNQINIVKRKANQSATEYEAYIESVYSEYPSLIPRDSDGKIISPRKKLPHELNQDEFIVDGKIIEIKYGESSNEEDMEEYTNNPEAYKKSIRNFYTVYYKSFEKEINSMPKINKNKEDFIRALEEVLDNKENISIVDINDASIKEIINTLRNDTTPPTAADNAYFMKISGSNLVYNPNLVFQMTVSQETHNKIYPLITKNFGEVLKDNFKNTDKNLYIKSEIKKRIATMPERRDEIQNKQLELLKKADQLLDFDASTETDLVELVGAVIPRSKKDEFLSVMRQAERTGFKLDHFVPIEMPPKFSGGSVRRYELGLCDRYREARPEYFYEDGNEYIFDTKNRMRKPYPHEMFKWTEDNQPSISVTNNESEHYRYYVDYGVTALMRKSKVTSKANIKDKPKLLKRLSDKLGSVVDKYRNVPVLNFFLDNDVIRAIILNDESYRDVTISSKAIDAFGEKLFNYSLIAGALVILPPFQIGILNGIAFAATATIAHQLLDTFKKIRNCYDNIKVSKCDMYTQALDKLIVDIRSIEKEIAMMDGAPSSPTTTRRKEDLLERLKAKIVAFKKTQKNFNKAYAKLSRKTINDWQDEEERFHAASSEFSVDYPDYDSIRGGIGL